MHPVGMLGWFVCPTFSMVTTSKAAGLDKTISFVIGSSGARAINVNEG